eukprot:5418499-Pyramimonas_sp.AAC.1
MQLQRSPIRRTPGRLSNWPTIEARRMKQRVSVSPESSVVRCPARYIVSTGAIAVSFAAAQCPGFLARGRAGAPRPSQSTGAD